jgi:benzoate membrane transport protein
MRNALRDASLSATVAGFVAVLVGYTSSVVIVFQAAAALGATPAQLTSWVWALGIGMAVTSAGLSLWTRDPVLTAWSTPGAAVLATAAAGVPMAEGIGAFIACAALTTLAGATGWFERVMNKIPQSLAAALLAGVLAHFALEAFLALQTQRLLVSAMFAVYLAGRRWWPRYAVPGVLAAGIAIAAAQGQLHFADVQWRAARPVFTMPAFSLPAMIGVALPLFVVTMASQNLPGVAAQRANGYRTPVSPVIAATGLVNLVLAPFGAFAMNLAAITAAICMGREAHEDPKRRYMAAVMAGLFYLVTGVLGGAIVGLIAAFPKELVLAVAGFALLGTIGAGLSAAMKDETARDPALITFLVTLSGVTLWRVGSPFWGVVAGVIAMGVLKWTHPRAPAGAPPQGGAAGGPATPAARPPLG